MLTGSVSWDLESPCSIGHSEVVMWVGATWLYSHFLFPHLRHRLVVAALLPSKDCDDHDLHLSYPLPSSPWPYRCSTIIPMQNCA